MIPHLGMLLCIVIRKLFILNEMLNIESW